MVNKEFELDRLAEAANRERSAAAMATLWSAAFSVASWTLIGRAGSRRFEPLTTTYEGLLCALSFTGRERANAFLDEQGLTGESVARAELFTLPVPSAVDLLDELQSVGVECVLMNEGTGPFVAPLAGLLRLFAAHGVGTDG